MKACKSESYNWILNEETGYFARWGKTKEDDPQMSPVGPEILDLEITTICSKGCPWCYKSNTNVGKNMTFETFKKIFDKLTKNLTQIAFGIGDIDANPDMWRMFEYCRENRVVPNVTINGENLTDEHVQKLVKLCGAVAVSHYDDNTCYGAVRRLTDAGLKQVNIHQLVSEETYKSCMQVFNDMKWDRRLMKLNAVVFLSLKEKGKRNKLHRLSVEKFESLIHKGFELGLSFGFDSCTACKFMKAIRDRDNKEELEMMCEPCESGLFSSYINVDGKYFPCSFTEGVEGYEGIDVANCDDFMKDVWFSDSIKSWREKLLGNSRACPVFNI